VGESFHFRREAAAVGPLDARIDGYDSLR